MKKGIGESIVDNIIIPAGLGVVGLLYYIRYLFRKFKL